MRIDQSHRGWARVSAGTLAIACIGYFVYYFAYPEGLRGNTVPGLIYGFAGYGMMLFAGLMGARRRVPLWRVGRASVWMRGHLWMGTLSLPMILLHSAFRARGPLTLVLMTLLTITVLSGVAGAAIQHFGPRRLTRAIPNETIYEQIPHVLEQLRTEAERVVEELCAEPELVAAGATMDTGRLVAPLSEEDAPPPLSEDDRRRLRQIYVSGIRPFLRDPNDSSPAIGSSSGSVAYFEALRRQSPLSVHESLRTLEHIVDEARQLSRQSRMYVWLHAWLLVHVPLSITLLVLGGIHAFMAVRY